MDEPVTPAADRVTAEAVVVEQHRAVVPATTWLVDAARAAVRDGKVLQVRTPARSRLTVPLELLLRDALADWVVRDDTGAHHDGFRGFPLAWNGIRFVRDTEAPPRTSPAPVPGSGDLEVRIITVGEAPRLGASTEAAMQALGGGPPGGWGVAEPVTQPWSAGDLAAHCRQRAARPVNVLVTGPGTVGRVRVSQVDGELVEEVELSGPRAGTVARDDIEALVERVAAEAQMMTVGAHPGRRRGLRAPGAPPVLPYGVLFGPEFVAACGVAHAHRAPAARVRLVGTGRRTAAWCRFDGGRTPAYEQFADLLQHFGQ
ncbi:DUF6177 family protein [Amycolatopsis benzoatilytica]|uniref:DUF6177 family protein n=1 Tax=Amycolatopsis benzoatilytica TaxID=346045 RepID=UPI000366A169|nr:DUF6177 family protein [Amycolatopsis benzoatilytica]